MKSLSIVTLVICLFVTGAYSQTSNPVDNLLGSRNFAFVVKKIQKKSGYNGPEQTSFPYMTVPPPSTMSIADKQAVTNDPKFQQTAVQQKFYSLSEGDGSYFSAQGLSQKGKPQTKFNVDSNIYFVQQKQSVLINSSPIAANPQLMNNDTYSSFNKAAYTLKSTHKKNGEWVLDYALNAGEKPVNFQIEIKKDGKAVLKYEATNDARYYLYGYITDASKMTFSDYN